MSKKTRKKSAKAVVRAPSAKSVSEASTKPWASAAKKASKKSKVAPARKTASGKIDVTPTPMAATLTEGDPAPSFLLPRDGGQSVSLASYAGRKLVIFFYPRANTPGCTLEAIDFSRLANAFAASETAVLGVSADPLKSQESFRDKHELTVPLVSDEKLEALKAYGVWGEKSLYGKKFMGITRTTVLIDVQGKIAHIWRKVKVDGHAAEVLAAARAI